jgi:2-polyprenyl-3-methyl-5-hydroxy-6-metoxy-1,4-benzoquinol methylase
MKRRSFEKELIDLGHYTEEEYADCLHQLNRIGKYLGGDRATLQEFSKLQTPPLSILDIGCGGGAFTAKLAQIYPEAQVIGIDNNPKAIQFTTQYKLKNLFFRCQSSLDLDPEKERFDVVTATLLCHHLNDQELIGFLKNCKSLAKKAVILNDLERHPLAYYGFKCIAPLFFNNRLICHDGLLSIKRSFKKEEWDFFLKEAHYNAYAINKKLPFRIAVSAFF